eukprot:1138326-Pelagomonas_calceolata.AAC.4
MEVPPVEESKVYETHAKEVPPIEQRKVQRGACTLLLWEDKLKGLHCIYGRMGASIIHSCCPGGSICSGGQIRFRFFACAGAGEP